MQTSIATVAREIAAARSLPDDARLDPHGASAFLAVLGRPVKPSTLARWRCARADGPHFVKSGKSVAYTVAALREFASRPSA